MSVSVFNVRAQGSSAMITDIDYPETVPASSLVEVELSVEYYLNKAEYLNPYILYGDEYDFFSEVVTETYTNVTGSGKEVYSFQFTAPEEEGEYMYQAIVGWNFSGAGIGLFRSDEGALVNFTIAVTEAEITVPVESGDDPVNGGETGGIPGFPVMSVIYGLVLVSVAVNLKKRASYQASY